jgi:hypothetical protein
LLVLLSQFRFHPLRPEKRYSLTPFGIEVLIRASPAAMALRRVKAGRLSPTRFTDYRRHHAILLRLKKRIVAHLGLKVNPTRDLAAGQKAAKGRAWRWDKAAGRLSRMRIIWFERDLFPRRSADLRWREKRKGGAMAAPQGQR